MDPHKIDLLSRAVSQRGIKVARICNVTLIGTIKR